MVLLIAKSIGLSHAHWIMEQQKTKNNLWKLQ